MRLDLDDFIQFLEIFLKDCSQTELVANGVCNDESNNGDCHFDGGDCTTTQATTSGTGGCNSGWIGDNFCDDINNNMDCSYDGGDCCGSCGEVVNTAFCSDCTCLDPNGSGGGTTCSTTTPNPGTYAPALTCSLQTGKKVKMIIANIFVYQVLFCICLW